MTLIQTINSFLEMFRLEEEVSNYFPYPDLIDFKVRSTERTPNNEILVNLILFDKEKAYHVVVITDTDYNILGYEVVEEVVDPGLHLFP